MSNPLHGLKVEQVEQLQQLPGVVATAVISGDVKPQYAEALSDLRDFNSRAGFVSIEYRNFYAYFVETGRDAITSHMLSNNYQWMLQIDADAAPFAPSALVRLLRLAFVEMPHADVIGAYCQQKSHPYLPTIDTGTGTWEEHYPNSGILEVIRTGCHFFLTKRSAIEKMGAPPWFRSRRAPTAAETLAEFDGLCRRSFDGRNPFGEAEEWDRLNREAIEGEKKRLLDGGGEPSLVGEDSSFCDRLRASGGKIFVDTSIVVGHITTRTIGPSDLKRAVEEREKKAKRIVGVLE